ncbi:hypothetical protein ACFL27_16390 [candidate division CSSED10-310 bacterium]|uniref:Glycosyltransferase RgtA/B/C/D-like domain-containing protein n=1 Tax=candidate division CSSED10-310 bacterium TaxID=2855610 RepID=A0ABV6YZZ1_UNCC1
MAFKHRGKLLLESGFLPIILIILALVLCSPSLWIGFQMDDHFHRLHFSRTDLMPDVSHDLWDLFTFMKGDESNDRMQDFGTLPWWTTTGIRASFWRPLSVLTHLLDYTLWPDIPALMHLHSMLWYGALVVVVWLLYRNILGITWVAGLAAVLYTIDQGHAWPACWLANRNSLLATFFGCLTLIVHDRWRRLGWKHGRFVGPLILLSGLFSAEAAIATLAYIFAYMLFLEEGSFRKRFSSLVPYGLVAVIWWIIYHIQGYGTWGMELYLDPGSEPLRYLKAVVERAPFLIGAQFGFPPAFIFIFLDETVFFGVWVIAVLCSAVFILALLPLVVKNNHSRFWFTGMILSLLPICATFPHERLLLFVGLGGCGLMAQFLGNFFEKGIYFPRSRLWYSFALMMVIFWIISRAIISPLMFPISAWSPASMGIFSEKVFQTLPDDALLKTQDFIVINPPVTFYMIYFPVIRALNEEPFPRHLRVLASGVETIDVTRPDANSLLISPAGGFINAPMDNLFRGKGHVMVPGQEIVLTNLTIRIMKVTATGRPSQVLFTFSQPLESPVFRWYYFDQGHFKPFTLPSVGQSLTIPHQDYDPLRALLLSLKN